MQVNLNLRSLGLYLFGLAACFHSCTCSDKYEPVRSDEVARDESAPHRYKADEILVMYKGTPSAAERDTIRRALVAAGIDTASVTIKTCNSCNAYVELWHADSIHTVIHEEGIRAGTVSGGSNGVGEDALARYSLNYLQHLPVDSLPDMSNQRFQQRGEPMTGAGKDTIVIAVLDTGLDQAAVSGAYQWNNIGEGTTTGTDDDMNCYTDDQFGWNFISNSPHIHDDNLNLHGTIISQFIVSEFKKFQGNFPQIMSLKTHDSQGRGDLFSAICALHYAMDKGADIINASWGFYYYQDNTHPYLDSLITQVLKQKGILFVTASGNKIDAIDAYARKSYKDKHGVTLPDSLLRDLEIHNFYPACLAEAFNNVIVATTTNGSSISPTQNYSSRFVDFGVVADTVTATYMKFEVPFTTNSLFISGSSFATAILSGKIGALAKKSAYQTNLNKQDIIDNIASGGSGVMQTSGDLESRNLVRDGRYIKRE